MTFATPTWLIAAAAAVPLLVVVFWLSRIRAKRMLNKVADSALQERLMASVSVGKGIVKAGLLVAAVVLMCISFARPQWGFTIVEEQMKGIDVLIALDTSRSMLAEDIRPNRLERAKFAIYDLVENLQGDRVGLVAFAGSAFLQCPLTLDYDAFKQTLETIDTDIIPQQGTDVAAAIEEAKAAFPKSQNQKLLILISDGEDLEANGIAAARKAGEEGIRIFTVGVGSEKGELIRVTDANGRTDFLRDSATGQPVQSRLDSESLAQIAEVSGGFYQPITNPNALLRIYEEGLASIPGEERESRVREVPIERFQYPLAAAIALLLLEPLINNRRRLSANAKGLAMIALMALLGLMATPERLSAETGKATKSPSVLAYEAYKKQSAGAFEEAVALYDNALETADRKSPIDRWNYNKGLSLLELQRYEDAATAFANAQQTADMKLLADAYHNRGVSLLQQAYALRESDPMTALGLWRQAIGEFYQLTQIEPETADEYNRIVRDFLTQTAILTVQSNNTEGGTAGESGRYLKGSTVKLKAKAHKGWRFGGWTGAEVADAAAEETELVITDTATVQAAFIKVWPLKLSAVPDYAGQVGQEGEYDADAPAPIMAQAIEGYAFEEWQGDSILDSSVPQTGVMMDGPKEVTAIFKRTHTLVVRAEKAGLAELTGTGDYGMGERVSISVKPAQGYLFERWEGDVIDDPYATETFVTATGIQQDVVAILKQDPSQQQDQENEEQQKEENQQEQDSSQQNQDQSKENQDQQQSGDEGQDGEKSEQEGSEEQQNQEDSQEQKGEEGNPEEEQKEQQSAQEGQEGEEPTEGEPQEAQQAGVMTRAEAVRLLEALKESEKKLPSRAPMENKPQREGRNW